MSRVLESCVATGMHAHQTDNKLHSDIAWSAHARMAHIRRAFLSLGTTCMCNRPIVMSTQQFLADEKEEAT